MQRCSSAFSACCASRRSRMFGSRNEASYPCAERARDPRRPPCRPEGAENVISSPSPHAGHFATAEISLPKTCARSWNRRAEHSPQVSCAGSSSQTLPNTASARSTGSCPAPRSQRSSSSDCDRVRMSRYTGGSVNCGSCGSGTASSRIQPSFSSLMCWMATALAFASRSGKDWYSDTQQRNTL
jgi:hypothetical protein